MKSVLWTCATFCFLSVAHAEFESFGHVVDPSCKGNLESLEVDAKLQALSRAEQICGSSVIVVSGWDVKSGCAFHPYNPAFEFYGFANAKAQFECK